MADEVPFPASFPSDNNFYRTFNGGSWTCDEDGGSGKLKELRNNLNIAFSAYSEVLKQTENIRKAYCFASKKKEEDPSHDDTPCWFFYYWLEDILPKGGKMEDVQFQSHINSICTLIKDAHEGNRCKLTCSENLNRENFKQRKTIHDYSYNYKTIEKDLLKIGPICQQRWSTHRKKVTSACKAVSEKCPDRESGGASFDDPYCKDFKDKYNFYCGAAQALESYCTKKADLEVAQQGKAQAQEQAQSTFTKLNEAESKASAASSLSSTFGTLAALEFPALAFFLYKYKPWSFWFGNHTSGNGRSGRNTRKRRSSTHNFGSSTEDTLTTYSTENSTIGPTESSTIDGIVPSTPYTRQPNKGQRNNAGSRGMVGYQNL
ncbi:KIR-like protein [Plasmodium coatneyi]|uniref:KIR-like protein n=1 Tax=Plasmodium coatneyi TaxID=208452 RepID=A0A1B1DU26_9APIC|nr:KIR-like protein [Plasmodium coatneyi]ANQ06244.1 KIR-like protein [Plasmodium coatneyi]